MKFVSVYFPDSPTSAPTPEHMEEMGRLVGEMTGKGVLLETGPLTRRETGGFAVRLKDGAFTVDEAPRAAWMRASGYALMQAPSRAELIPDIERFLSTAGDGACELLEVLDMGPEEESAPAAPASRELVLDRLLDAPREAVYRCWTEPELMKQWFAPKPWEVVSISGDVRPGGASDLVMRGPDGAESGGKGVYLEVIPNEKIVFTDAFSTGWIPSDGMPFMVAEITFADEGGKTRYVARARHWSDENVKQHEAMGFHEGWSLCADQLEALAKTL